MLITGSKQRQICAAVVGTTGSGHGGEGETDPPLRTLRQGRERVAFKQSLEVAGSNLN